MEKVYWLSTNLWNCQYQNFQHLHGNEACCESTPLCVWKYEFLQCKPKKNYVINIFVFHIFHLFSLSAHLLNYLFLDYVYLLLVSILHLSVLFYNCLFSESDEEDGDSEEVIVYRQVML